MPRFLALVRFFAIGVALFAVLASMGIRSARAAGVVGNGTPGSCTQAAFDAKFSDGGTITFNCGSNPVIITFTVLHTVAANTTIDGGKKVTLSASNVAHFHVNAG